MKNIFKTMLTIGIIKKAIIALVLLSTSLNAQLDRSIMPDSGPAPEIFFGKPQTFKLDNGLTVMVVENTKLPRACLLYTSPSPRDATLSRMPSSA